jgi:uncharacterized membrane protein YwzB
MITLEKFIIATEITGMIIIITIVAIILGYRITEWYTKDKK